MAEKSTKAYQRNCWFEIDGLLPRVPRPDLAVHIRLKRGVGPCYPNREHEHLARFLWVIAGRRVVIVNGRPRTLEPGLGILHRNTDSAVAWDTAKQVDSEFEFGLLVFTGDSALCIVDDMIQRYGHVFALPDDMHLTATCLRLADGPLREVSMNPAQGARMVTDMLFALINRACGKERQGRHGELVQAIKSAVSRAGATGVTINQLADTFNVSREYLSRSFHQSMGVTLKKHIAMYRSREAIRLLEESDLSLQQIAERLGFSGGEAFYRFFRKEVGIAPGAYRAGRM